MIENDNLKKQVAIIGTGPTGLLAIKYALYYGFQPVAFQKNQQIGGVWNPKDGAVWKQMTTNLSKHTCSFFDFPWPQQAPIYPSSGQMMNYLNSYATRHDLLKYIKFCTEVVKVKKIQENDKTSYHVAYKQNGQRKEQIFQYVIVASGIFSVPIIPEIQGLNQFKGKIIHSKNYRHGEEFKDKKVLVVGGSFTGVELASNVSKYAQKVIHSFKQPFWILPHFIGAQQNKMPIDFFYNREFYLTQPSKTLNFDKNSRYSKSLCKQQQQFQQLRISQSQFQLPIYISISSDYIQNFKSKKICPLRSKIVKFSDNKVHLACCIDEKGEQKKQSVEEIDAIIFCTGYKSSLSYLSQEIKKTLEYDENDRLQPIILYKQMYHPQLKNMFFAGMYKGPYFPVMQLQVKAAFEYFIGKAIIPSKQQIQKSLQQQRQIRTKIIRSQFPHPDYINFADSIAMFAGQNLQLDRLKNIIKDNLLSTEDEKSKKQQALRFFKMSVFPCIPDKFTTNNIEQQIKSSTQLIQNFINSRKIN